MTVSVQNVDGTSYNYPAFMVASEVTTDGDGLFTVDLSDYGYTELFGIMVNPVAASSSATDALTHSVYEATSALVRGAVYRMSTGLPADAGVLVLVSVFLV